MMRLRLLPTLPLVIACGMMAACSSTPPPQAPTEEIAKESWPSSDANTSPPKCESLDEGCKAKGKTFAKIAKTALTLSPPKGWLYAQTTDALIAETNGEGALIVAGGFEVEPKDKKKQAKARDEALAVLLEQVMLSAPPKKKVNWTKKGDDERDIAGMKLSLWQLDGGSRKEAKGPLLVFLADLGEGKELIGVGFVPSDDTSGADSAIIDAIESIKASAKAESPDQ